MQEVKINIDNKDLKGLYSNMMQAQSSQEEFCLDFFNVFPPTGALVARIITSPGHLKRMIKALQEILDKYEGNFGAITIAPEPEKPKIGFSV
jgi:hypothetical protein